MGVAFGYLGTYLALRLTMTGMVGIWGLKQDTVWKKLALIPVWDALAFCIWLTSFSRNSIRWRNVEYYIRDGKLEPVVSTDPAHEV
jgi:ceramide glucosyltransferase